MSFFGGKLIEFYVHFGYLFEGIRVDFFMYSATYFGDEITVSIEYGACFMVC